MTNNWLYMIDFARIWGYNEHENETEREAEGNGCFSMNVLKRS